MRSKQEVEELYLLHEYLVKNTLYKSFSNHHKFAKMHGLEEDDLLQLGKLGLLKAAETYSSSKNTQFQSYAISMIKYYIVREAKKCSLRSRTKATFEIVNSVSIETPVTGNEGEEVCLHDTLRDNSDAYMDADMRISLEGLKKVLPERIVKVIQMRMQGYTQKEIGKEIGVSSQYIGSIIEKNKEIIYNRILA